MSALEKPHGSKCPPCTASHKLREVIHRGDKALPLACLVGGRGLSRGLCRSLGMTRRVRLHQGQAGARVVGFLTDLGEGGASAASPEGVAHTPQAGHSNSTSMEHPPRPSSYPLAQPLDVAEPGNPLRGVDVSGVGAAMVHLRGHLGWGGQDGEPHVGAPAGLTPTSQGPPLLTFACRAIWRATKGRFRSDTILAMLVSTRPSMSGETWRSHGAQPWSLSLPPCPPPRLTFPALQRHQVALVVQGGDNHMDEVELALLTREQGHHGAKGHFLQPPPHTVQGPDLPRGPPSTP